MEMSKPELLDFTSTLVKRGMGLYGREKMALICYDSGVALLDDDSVDFMNDNYKDSLDKFLIKYASFNLVAKMTVIALARQNNIELPAELNKKSGRKSRFRRLFKRT